MKNYHAIKQANSWDKIRGHGLLMIKNKLLILLLLCYAIILLLTAAYLNSTPVFVSSMSLVLPGTGKSSNFNIEEVGQVSTSTKTPFSGGGFNPRVNYKEIIRSHNVISAASKQLTIEYSSFGKPRVNLTAQTSIIKVASAADKPELALQKSWALYNAFQEKLNQLRADESERYYESIKYVLEDYQRKVDTARAAILNFQQKSLIVSVDQWPQLTLQLTELQNSRTYLQAQAKNLQHFVNQLSADLGVSPALAGQAFIVQSDALFQSLTQELQQSSSTLSEYRSHWGEMHPKYRSALDRFNQAQQSLIDRSNYLVGSTAADSLHTMNLQMSVHRADLFASLVDQYAKLQGTEAELADLDLSERRLEDKLRIYSREVAELERLEREAKLAEAVYSSAAARIDASKAEIFASYPVVQLLTPPLQPQQKKSPKLSIAIAASAFGIIFTTLGFFLLWKRQDIIDLLLKKS